MCQVHVGRGGGSDVRQERRGTGTCLTARRFSDVVAGAACAKHRLDEVVLGRVAGEAGAKCMLDGKVVVGRVAGAACATYMLGGKVNATSSAELSGGGFLVKCEVAKLAGRSDEDMMNV